MLRALVILLLVLYVLCFAIMYVVESGKAGHRVSMWVCFRETNAVLISKLKKKLVVLKLWNWFRQIRARRRKG